MHTHSLFSKLLKEPLLHFLLIGIAIFFLYAQINSNEEDGTIQEIHINSAKLDQFSNTFVEKNNRVPTKKELQILLEEGIRNEILYHEALAIGLDKDDPTIQHRLAEKMKYIFEDVTVVEDPSDDVLKNYFKKNAKNFMNASGTIPNYNEAKQQVLNEWVTKEQQKENNAFYNTLKSHYKVTIEGKVKEALKKSSSK